MQKRSTDLRDVSISSVTDDSKTILDASISTIRNEIEVKTDASISIQEELLMVAYLIMCMCVPTILKTRTG